ncbi:FadR/GntR family transcriptional regulator [Chelativorans sp. AA-79]|uniref:FadR/GntR family transcriptional regulator n=1 Tax=Chelativorans sp. AA-79 TaxID=3028735 RepID=UPI0023F82DB4|nr:FadR/GntR family transcriptional regulator [Chelativorans sp. AA-79]WEX10983.1 FadR/GntR family transcriptional regulator [Chelativorans sp. AA-79]
MTGKVNWQSRTAHAAAAIGKAIVTGQFPEGAGLPREPELAAAFGVSRNTLREAMKALAAKSLVEIAPRRGTVVLPSVRWNVLDPDVLDWSGGGLNRDARFMQELLTTRQAVEPMAAAEAALRATRMQRQAVARAWEAMASLADSMDIPAKIEIDLAFHVAIADASNNRFLISIMGSITHALRENLRMLNDEGGNYEGNLANHRLVSEAIARGDAEAARAAMNSLVAQARADTSRQIPELNDVSTDPDAVQRAHPREDRR